MSFLDYKEFEDWWTDYKKSNKKDFIKHFEPFHIDIIRAVCKDAWDAARAAIEDDGK